MKGAIQDNTPLRPVKNILTGLGLARHVGPGCAQRYTLYRVSRPVGEHAPDRRASECCKWEPKRGWAHNAHIVSRIASCGRASSQPDPSAERIFQKFVFILNSEFYGNILVIYSMFVDWHKRNTEWVGTGSGGRAPHRGGRVGSRGRSHAARKVRWKVRRKPGE